MTDEDAPTTLTLTRTRKALPGWALPVARVWRRDTPHGTHLAGVLGSARLLIILTPKNHPDDPDAVVCITPRVDGRPPPKHATTEGET